MRLVKPDATINLAPVTSDNLDACLALDVDENQRGLVAPNVKSLAEAYVNPHLFPWAIYDGAAIGWEHPQSRNRHSFVSRYTNWLQGLASFSV